MDNKKSKPIDQATVVKQRSTKSARHKIQKAALTQINNSFRSIDTSQGFSKAKKDADKALAENKIVLNKRFILESTLGVGGMGTVYKAQDLRKVEASDLNPFIAVKILNAEFQNHPDAFVTLQRETSRTQILSHPNIITVHDFDRDGDVIYMTMELLEGKGLDALLLDNINVGLPVEQAIKIITDYCVALEHAHNKGVIHSDLKPGNIFVTKSGTKVLDFGIARITAEATNVNDFDAGTLGAMTPAYASFEMIQHLQPNQSDDVFAAAVIAYELFTGEHPYNRKPADVALAEGITPKRIKELSKRQWRAMSSALKIKQKDRTASIKKFLDDLTLKKKLPVFKISSLVLTLALGWFAYNEFYSPDELSAVIEDTLVKGNDCYSNQNYKCSIESANVILEISPSHAEALSLLETSREKYLSKQISELVTTAEKCLVASDINCAQDSLDELERIAPQSPHVVNLNQLIENQQRQIQNNALLIAAKICYHKKDYNCVLTKSKTLFDIGENSEQISTLKQIKLLIKKSKKNIFIINRKYAVSLAKGEQCFNKKDYECAEKHSKLALKYKPGDSDANTLYQNSYYARSEKIKNISKIKKILVKAEKCLQIKNYSCAIAKSESALEIIPDYKDAIKLKSKATNAVEKLKRSIIIE